MGRRLFITATDTGAGKSYLTRLLIEEMLHRGIAARAVKPVAAGCNEEGVNEDVDLLMQAQGINDPAAINLYSFALAASPNLAAAAESAAIEPARLVAWCRAQERGPELLLIEGVGGLMVPLTDDYLVSDWIADMVDYDVVVVVGSRLGCINHALLTLDKLQRMGRPPMAVVINNTGNAQAAEQAAAALQPRIQAPTSLIRLPYAAGLNHDSIKDILASLGLAAHSA